MADRVDFHYKQKVTQGELDLAFAEMEEADRNLTNDYGLTGILAPTTSMLTAQNTPTQDGNVLVSSGVGYSKLGERINVNSQQTVDVLIDSNGTSTDVPLAGESRIVTLVAIFARAESDPRTDGNGATVYFRQQESFTIKRVQGAAHVTPTPPTLTGEDADGLIVADVTRAQGDGGIILTAAIDDSRKEIIVDFINYDDHVAGTADKHAAAHVTYAGSGNWADGNPLSGPPTDVEAAIDTMVSDLASSVGVTKLGSADYSSPNGACDLTAGTLRAQLEEICIAADDAAFTATTHTDGDPGKHASSEITHTMGETWYGGVPVSGDGTVEAILDGVLSDIGAGGGSAKIGAAVYAGTGLTLSSGSIQDQLRYVADNAEPQMLAKWTSGLRTVLASEVPGVLPVDPTSGAFQVNLPPIDASLHRRVLVVKNDSASTNMVTLAANGSNLIDAGGTKSMIAAWKALVLRANDNLSPKVWHVVGEAG